MKLRDLLNNDRLILVVCDDCGGRTPVDPAQHALRVGVDTAVADLKADMTCPVCGSAEISLASYSPLMREAPAEAHAK
jgi:hypothetical protein